MTSATSALNRIASATSILRTRDEDADRHDRNGGSKDDHAARVRAAAKELDKIARKLEALVAE